MKRFIARTQNTILSAAFILAVASGINAFLGVLKNRLLANYFGVSEQLAVFYTADRIPNLVYSIIIVGAVSTVFIPIFTSILKKDKSKAFETASSIINATLFFFITCGIIIFFFAPQIVKALSLGKFSEEEIIMGTNLMRIMLASQLLLVGGSLATSLLQSFKYFLIPALAPVAYNLGMIGGIVLLSNKYGIYGPAIGVLFGSLLHFGIQLPLIQKTGYTYSFSLNFKDKGFRELLKLVPARIGSVLVASIIQTINNSLAILVSTSSVVYLKFATQLQTFPVIFVGLSMAAASLPTLSRQGDKENLQKFKETFLTSFHQTMFMVLPLSMILVILRIPTIRLVYGVSSFPWEATLETARTLAIFSISIFSQSGNYLLTRAFYALKDTKTPVIVSLCTATINIGLSILLVSHLNYGVWALALTFSISSILDTLILFFLLNKKVGKFNTEDVLAPFVKIALATISMGVTLYIPMKLLDVFIFDTTRTINLIAVTGIAGICGIGTYLLFTKIFEVKEIELLYKLAKKMKPSKSVLAPQTLSNVDDGVD